MFQLADWKAKLSHTIGSNQTKIRRRKKSFKQWNLQGKLKQNWNIWTKQKMFSSNVSILAPKLDVKQQPSESYGKNERN